MIRWCFCISHDSWLQAKTEKELTCKTYRLRIERIQNQNWEKNMSQGSSKYSSARSIVADIWQRCSGHVSVFVNSISLNLLFICNSQALKEESVGPSLGHMLRHWLLEQGKTLPTLYFHGGKWGPVSLHYSIYNGNPFLHRILNNAPPMSTITKLHLHLKNSKTYQNTY